MRRPAAAGGRLGRTRTPAATGTSPGEDATSPAGILAGTWPADGTTRSRGAAGNSRDPNPGGGGMTAVPAISGQRPALTGAGAPASPRTSRPGHVTSIPIRAGGLAAGPRPLHLHAWGAIARRARRVHRTKRRATGGDTVGGIRPRTRPAGSCKATWSRELPAGRRPGASSLAAATSWSRGQMTAPGRTATPTTVAPKAAAAAAACSAGADVTPTRNPISSRGPGTPGRPPQPPRSGRPRRSAARVVAGRLPLATRLRRAVRSGRGVRWVLATRFRRGVRCLLEVRFRPAGPFRPAVRWAWAVRFLRVVRCREAVRSPVVPGRRIRMPT